MRTCARSIHDVDDAFAVRSSQLDKDRSFRFFWHWHHLYRLQRCFMGRWSCIDFGVNINAEMELNIESSILIGSAATGPAIEGAAYLHRDAGRSQGLSLTWNTIDAAMIWRDDTSSFEIDETLYKSAA